MAGRDDDMLRLITVIDHQRRELDRIHAFVAQESVVAMARGALMERLGLSSADAAALATRALADGDAEVPPLLQPARASTSMAAAAGAASQVRLIIGSLLR